MTGNKALAVVTGAVAAGALLLGGWYGYEEWSRPRMGGEAIRGYDSTDPMSTAPQTENVFTGRVLSFEGHRDIDSWASDVYEVEVESVLRGNLSGTVTVTYALDEGVPDRLTDGATYIFATHGSADPAVHRHAHLYDGEMKPVDDAQLAVWRKAVALPMAQG